VEVDGWKTKGLKLDSCPIVIQKWEAGWSLSEGRVSKKSHSENKFHSLRVDKGAHGFQRIRKNWT
jgi:hypothetical protein